MGIIIGTKVKEESISLPLFAEQVKKQLVRCKIKKKNRNILQKLAECVWQQVHFMSMDILLDKDNYNCKVAFILHFVVMSVLAHSKKSSITKIPNSIHIPMYDSTKGVLISKIKFYLIGNKFLRTNIIVVPTLTPLN